jgi:hypothetical protein
MSLLMKIAVVLFCSSLRGAGAFIASSPHKEMERQKTGVTPVKNREVVGRFWIET